MPAPVTACPLPAPTDTRPELDTPDPLPVPNTSVPDEPEVEVPLLTTTDPLEREMELEVDNRKSALAEKEISPPAAFDRAPESRRPPPDAIEIDPPINPFPLCKFIDPTVLPSPDAIFTSV